MLEVTRISSPGEKFKAYIAASIVDVPLQKVIPYSFPINFAKSLSNFFTDSGYPDISLFKKDKFNFKILNIIIYNIKINFIMLDFVGIFLIV